MPTVASTNLAPLSTLAAPDTCTWTGTTSGVWSDGTNWSGCDNGGVPEDGDTLVFPIGAGDVVIDNSREEDHAMYVESVNEDGTINISQYNAGKSGLYSEATISPRGLVFIQF